MSVAAFGGLPFSTTVNFWLEKDGQRIDLSHLAPGELRSREPLTIEPGVGQLVTVIDGRQRRRTICLWGARNETTLRYRPDDAIPF